MLPFNLTYIALGDGHAVLDPIAWVQHDLIFHGEAGLDLCHPTVTLPEPDVVFCPPNVRWRRLF
jgi:hypothetical protein